MIGRKSVILSVSVIAILVSSTIFVSMPAIPRASAQGKVPGANWEYNNYDSHGTNYNPQTQITKENVALLELKWMYPIPPSSSVAVDVAEGRSNRKFFEGSTTVPLIVDGIVYFETNYYLLTAVDAGTGKTVWTYQYNGGNFTQARARLPIYQSYGHLHGIYYIDGNIIFPGVQCDIIAVNAITGKVSWTIQDLCANIPGSAGFYFGQNSYPPVIYKKGNILVLVPTPWDGMTGRGFVAGYDMSAVRAAVNYAGPPKWRTFTVPPAGGDPDWAVRVRDKIWIQGVKGTDIPVELLKNDWGDLGTIQFEGVAPGRGRIRQTLARAGTGNEWGQMAVDEEAGLVYLGLSQPTPDWNATYRPGPNLFSASVIALKADTGELVWAHQTSTHDLWDWDCSWNVLLGNIGTRKAIFKGCKNGIVHAFDAANGELIWAFVPPSIKYCEFCPYHVGSKLNREGPDNYKLRLDNLKDTFTRPWANWPSKEPFWQNPTAAGGIEGDIAFDGKTVYAATYNLPSYYKVVPVEGLAIAGLSQVPPPYTAPTNSTIWAIDAASGKPKWSFFIDGVGYRGGVTFSGGVLYAGAPDGNMYALDADTGKVLWQKFFGNRLNIPPSIGATTQGKIRIFQVVGGAAASNLGIGQEVPGAVMVFGLPDKLPEPQIITKEVVKEVPKEVVKEVVKEVPKEVTKTVTVETISPISYAAIGISVVILVIAGVLFTRRKKA